MGFLRRGLRRVLPGNIDQTDLLIRQGIDLQRTLAHQEWRAVQALAQNKDQLLQHGAKFYSQNDEDGILHEILVRIGEGDRRLVEWGAGDGRENNTLHLLLSGWSGTWVDGDPKKTEAAARRWQGAVNGKRLQVVSRFLSKDNLEDLRQEAAEADVFSLDVDGNDFHLLAAVAPLRARVVIVEYNATLGPWVDWVMPYDPDHRWDGSDYYGASLAALDRGLRSQSYVLVGCNVTGVNAFFVRKDVAAKRFGASFTPEHHFQPFRPWLRPAFASPLPVGLKG